MIQEQIHQFIDNIKYFIAILLLCFNYLTPSLQSVSTSAFWLRQPHPLKSVSILAQTPPPKRADVILEHSLGQDNIPGQRLFSSLCQNTNNHTKIYQLTKKKFKNTRIGGTKITIREGVKNTQRGGGNKSRNLRAQIGDPP